MTTNAPDLAHFAALQFAYRRLAMQNARAAKARGRVEFARDFYLAGARLAHRTGLAYMRAAIEARSARRVVDPTPYLQAQVDRR